MDNIHKTKCGRHIDLSKILEVSGLRGSTGALHGIPKKFAEENYEDILNTWEKYNDMC